MDNATSAGSQAEGEQTPKRYCQALIAPDGSLLPGSCKKSYVSKYYIDEKIKPNVAKLAL